MMGNIKGFAWNCGGLRRHTASTYSKVMFFEKNFMNDFDFFFFIETHHKDDNDIPNELLRYKDTHHIIHSQTDIHDTHTGIIGLIRNNYTVDENDIEELIQGRILRFKMTKPTSNICYRIAVVYFPTNKKITVEDTQLFARKLRIDDETSNDIILGDFNFIDHAKDKKNGLNSKDHQICKIWEPFLEEMDMVDPFRAQNPHRKIWSFVAPTGNSRIDRIYVKSMNMNSITNMKYIHTPFHGHRVLAFCIKTDIDWGKSYYKLNTSLFEDDQFDNIVEETLAEIQKLTHRSYRDKWEVFMMTMKTKSIQYSTLRNTTKKKLKSELIRQIDQIEQQEHQTQLAEHYAYLKGRLKEIEDKEIDGYIKRVRYLVPYEKSEPDIAFFSKLEGMKRTKDGINQLAETKDGEIFTDNENIMRISTQFYKDLYTTDKVNEKAQNQLLKNVTTKLSKEAKTTLDKPFSEEEVYKAIMNLPSGKSPGIDGFPIEFYKEYWHSIHNLFMGYVNEVLEMGISNSRNVSVIKLVYKKTGEIYLLANYRPISLINADIKIITKVLSERLKFVLPTIIHATQTAVYGRKIDQNIHLVRDLIELANKNDETAAFIFLDQEKAFDRVNHKFLFKTMEAFGIGQNFIKWVSTIYANASSVLSINGRFSEKIPLKRGVRQGCPLSALLYVLVIEVLAIHLRLNPNIVGFKVGGEKIVSVHYMDDTTITITQNRCFKEVIKEIQLYESATEAKVNYKKTKGLWTGSWKGRRISPISNVTWTSGDVKNLGIYFGNKNPDKKTFEEIVPKFMKRLHYWKQFSFSKIGKARVSEMFLASRLVYAIKFYPIPLKFQKQVQDSISEFVNFPNKVITIAQKEMWKIKSHGGCKLVNIQVKSETSKAKWLMEIATKPQFKVNLELFSLLVGAQKGAIRGRDIMFLDKTYMTRNLKIDSPFYNEALNAVAMFERRKRIFCITDWDNEHLFYNPLIRDRYGNMLKETNYLSKKGVSKFGQLLEEKSKFVNNIPSDVKVTTLADNIVLDTNVEKYDQLFLGNGGEQKKMSTITQKELYEDAIFRISRDHSYQAKWLDKLNIMILFEEVWDSVHNPLSSNQTKTTIWEQIHLNFYTQYSYNKWKNTSGKCPLCNKAPENIYHIILHCDFVNSLWTHIQPTLAKFDSRLVTNEEKSFGIVHIKKTAGMLMRNWLTYKMREQVMDFERKAYHSPAAASISTFKTIFNRAVAYDIKKLMIRFNHEGKIEYFDKVVAYREILCKKYQNGNYQVNEVFQ